ncbi:hypothetical protein Bpfe_029739 [Biomphalaria pfeifferi]|uniref:Uncharacterized protein n=1 Tax=Biomphalaria pfeifferi TaxID=112525 RepID=A0AAD8AR68_BIOPF|nr:hypothetical protein Bpfe_029739 [Biomphalaria pfeifferi]
MFPGISDREVFRLQRIQRRTIKCVRCHFVYFLQIMSTSIRVSVGVNNPNAVLTFRIPESLSGKENKYNFFFEDSQGKFRITDRNGTTELGYHDSKPLPTNSLPINSKKLEESNGKKFYVVQLCKPKDLDLNNYFN